MHGSKTAAVLLAALFLTGLAATVALAETHGPYDTFLASRLEQGRMVYFKADDPAKTGGFYWLTLPAHGSPVLSVMHRAFERGQPVRVVLGPPYDNSLDEHKAASVKRAEVIIPQK